MNQNNQVITYLALTVTVIFWGLSFVATKVALESLPTFTLIFIRFGLAACLFLALMMRFGFPLFTLREHGKLLLTAMFEPGLYFIFETIGLQHTTAPKAALIIATIPLAVTVLASLLLGERTSMLSFLGIGISLAGISILVVGDPQFRWGWGGSLVGDILIFGAVISAAFYIICARDLGRNHTALEITGLQIIYGAFFYAPAFLWELPGINWSAISGRSLTAVVYLTVFATVAAFMCYNYALTRISASRASLFINCIPVVTALGAWVLLGEKLTRIQIGGGTLVLLSICLTSLPVFRPAPRKLKESVAEV
ncbi:DMT family transporter [Desulfonema magnum]|nr:EamA family transporter [Desulfonema magnum]